LKAKGCEKKLKNNPLIAYTTKGAENGKSYKRKGSEKIKNPKSHKRPDKSS